MWLPQGGALKIENLQFTQCITMLYQSILCYQSLAVCMSYLPDVSNCIFSFLLAKWAILKAVSMT